MEVMQFKLGDILKLKKKHPCGSDEWEVIRLGADIKIRCLGCEHVVMIPRHELQKNVKKIVSIDENK